MSAKFYTLLTDIGAAKLASATARGVPLNITQMAVGDGGGVLPTPSAQQTGLANEKRRAALNMLYIDPQNSSQIIAEQVIPETEGGWWIREVGLFDETGALIAVGNCPESYKPQLAEGSGRTQTVRMVLITSSTDNITLKIDPTVVLATRKYVDDKVLELKVYVDDLMAKHLLDKNPHSQYPLIANALKEMADAGLVSKVLENLGLRDSDGYQGRLLNVQVFDSTGSGIYTKTSGTKKIRVKVQGAGGGGGSASSSSASNSAFGSGGAAGAYAEVIIDNPGNTATVIVGAGGAAGASGGASSFGGYVSCPGGGGGSSDTGGSTQNLLGSGVLGSIPTITGVATKLNVSGPNAGDVGIRLSGGIGIAGKGASSVLSSSGHGRITSAAGQSPAGYGAGGNGAGVLTAVASNTGGVGGSGIVIIEEYA